VVKVQQNFVIGQNVLPTTTHDELQCKHHFTKKELIAYLIFLMKVIQSPLKTAAF
jgi:hypothetical protein